MPYALRDARTWVLAAVALVLAAIPYAGSFERERAAYDFLAVIDITTSMLVRDMGDDAAPLTRLDAAKLALKDMAEQLPCQSRVGLGVFTERRSFVLFDPIEVCADFAPLEAAIDAIDWRMAWEGDSYVAKGLHNALILAAGVKTDLIFLTDGHEAPPLPPGIGLPAFEGKPGETGGLIAGVGGDAKSPIPKYDDEGREAGRVKADDVPQENRTGPPPPDAEQRPGYHPKWAPFGTAPATGDEHLSSLRASHLTALAAQTGLEYGAVKGGPGLAELAARNARPRMVKGTVDLRPVAGLAALALLAGLYSHGLLRTGARRSRSHSRFLVLNLSTGVSR